MSARVVLTRRGAEELRTELRRLKSEDRAKVIDAIAEARAHGDLTENAEYDAAKEQQGFIEARISELESALSVADVIDPVEIGQEDKVVFGAFIDLYDVESDSEVSYQLVGNLEADISKGRISISAPIGKALLGRHVGDEVEVLAPGGSRQYEILGVSYK